MSLHIISPQSVVADISYPAGMIIHWEDVSDGGQVAYELQYKLKEADFWSTCGKVYDSLAREVSLNTIYEYLQIDFYELYYRIIVYYDGTNSLGRIIGSESSDVYSVIFRHGIKNTLKIFEEGNIHEYPLLETINIDSNITGDKVNALKINVDDEILQLPLVKSDNVLKSDLEVCVDSYTINNMHVAIEDVNNYNRFIPSGIYGYTYINQEIQSEQHMYDYAYTNAYGTVQHYGVDDTYNYRPEYSIYPTPDYQYAVDYYATPIYNYETVYGYDIDTVYASASIDQVYYNYNWYQTTYNVYGNSYWNYSEYWYTSYGWGSYSYALYKEIVGSVFYYAEAIGSYITGYTRRGNARYGYYTYYPIIMINPNLYYTELNYWVTYYQYYAIPVYYNSSGISSSYYLYTAYTPKYYYTTPAGYYAASYYYYSYNNGYYSYIASYYEYLQGYTDNYYYYSYPVNNGYYYIDNSYQRDNFATYNYQATYAYDTIYRYDRAPIYGYYYAYQQGYISQDVYTTTDVYYTYATGTVNVYTRGTGYQGYTFSGVYTYGYNAIGTYYTSYTVYVPQEILYHYSSGTYVTGYSRRGNPQYGTYTFPEAHGANPAYTYTGYAAHSYGYTRVERSAYNYYGTYAYTYYFLDYSYTTYGSGYWYSYTSYSYTYNKLYYYSYCPGSYVSSYYYFPYLDKYYQYISSYYYYLSGYRYYYYQYYYTDKSYVYYQYISSYSSYKDGYYYYPTYRSYYVAYRYNYSYPTLTYYGYYYYNYYSS